MQREGDFCRVSLSFSFSYTVFAQGFNHAHKSAHVCQCRKDPGTDANRTACGSGKCCVSQSGTMITAPHAYAVFVKCCSKRSCKKVFNSRSCRPMFSTPYRRTARIPSQSPAMAGVGSVPASYRSGASSGMLPSSELYPLPPSIKVSAESPSRNKKNPHPCGPKSPLCPGAQSASICMLSTLIGIDPADCAASTTNRIPLRRQSAPISARGKTAEQILEAWAQISMRVCGLIMRSIALQTSDGVACGSFEKVGKISYERYPSRAIL